MAKNKIIYGDETLIDLTNDTVSPNNLLLGETAHDRSGESIQGSLVVANNRRSFYGTCTDSADTVAKQVTLSNTDGWELVPGTTVSVKFSNSNTATGVTLNINGTGAKKIWYSQSCYTDTTGTSTTVYGTANRIITYVYDGTYWVWLSQGADNNTTYSTMAANEVYTGTETTAKLARADRLKTDINKLIDDKVNALDVTVSGASASKTLSTLSETDGKISATFQNIQIAESQVTNLTTDLGNKVDKVSGKDLSTNDYTTTEKDKLAGIAEGAEVNQNAFAKVKVNSTTINADAKQDTLELVQGSNVTLTPDATNDKVTIAATDTTYTISGGTNKITVTPSSGDAYDVTVTPSISNNITGSGTRTSGYLAKFSGTNTVTNGPQLGNDSGKYLKNDGTWDTPSDVTGNAATATKLQTARSISLDGDFQGSANFDGSANATINAYFYYKTCISGNKANFPYHRIAHIEGVTGTYQDRDAILFIRGGYNGGPCGMIRIVVRANAAGASVAGSAFWLFSYGFAASDVVIAIKGATGDFVADVFLKRSTYARTFVYQMMGNRQWELIASTEVNDTTASDKKTSTEVYSTVAQACIDIYGSGSTYTTTANSQFGSFVKGISLPRVTQDSQTLPDSNQVIFEEYKNGANYNLPTNHYYHIISMKGDSDNYGTQLALGMTTTGAYYRAYINQSWTEWQDLITAEVARTLKSATIRPTDANVQYADGGLRHYLASSSMASNKPNASDGNILHLPWDNDGGYDTQLYISHTGEPKVYVRAETAKTWNDWLPMAVFGQTAPTSGRVVVTDGTEGKVSASGYTIAKSVPSDAVFTDTKNTAGSTDSSSKLFLIGATSQAANPQTYSHDTAYVGTDGCLYSNGTKVLTAHQDISGKVDKSGDTITGTLILSRTTDASGTANNKPALIVGGTDTQAHLELDGNEIMAKANGTTTATLNLNIDGGNTVIGKSGLTVKPNKIVNNLVTGGSGTAAQDKGSGVSPRYFPAKWWFNTGVTPANGDIITIKIPVAGHSYGVFLSINTTDTEGGTNGNYYPIAVNGTSRLTTQFGVNTFLTLQLDTSGSVADMFALDGGDSRATVSGGCWRVINYYDSGNTVPSAYCNTGASTAAKTATCSNYSLLSKSFLHVLVVNTNTAKSALTLNVNSAGAKPIYINGSASSASNYSLTKGSYIVYYDGTNYYFRTDGKLTASITGDAATVNGKSVGVNVPSDAKFTDHLVSATKHTTIGSEMYPMSTTYFSTTGTEVEALTGGLKVTLGATTSTLSVLDNNNSVKASLSGLGVDFDVYQGSISNATTQKLIIAASNEANYKLLLGVNSDTMWTLAPNASGKLNLGAPANKWSQIYSTSGTINTSDRKEKKDIVDLDNNAKDFIMSLKPVSYKFIDGTSGRTHYGMIAQDVEEELKDLGMTPMDFAGFCKDQKTESYEVEVVDENGETHTETRSRNVEGEYVYGLRYEEFIAPMIKTIQMQQKEIDELKAQIKLLGGKG